MIRQRSIMIGGILIFVIGCQGTVQGLPDIENDDFLYVLQPDTISTAELTAAEFHWLVLEPSRDGSASGDFSPAEIAQIRNDGPCRKIALWPI